MRSTLWSSDYAATVMDMPYQDDEALIHTSPVSDDISRIDERMAGILFPEDPPPYAMTASLLTPYLYNRIKTDLRDHLREFGMKVPYSYARMQRAMGHKRVNSRLGHPVLRAYALQATTVDRHNLVTAADKMLAQPDDTLAMVDAFMEAACPTQCGYPTFATFALLADTLRLTSRPTALTPGVAVPAALRNAFVFVFSRKRGYPLQLARETATTLMHATGRPYNAAGGLNRTTTPRRILRERFGVRVSAKRRPAPHRFTDPSPSNVTYQEMLQALMRTEITDEHGAAPMFVPHRTLLKADANAYNVVRKGAEGIPGQTPAPLITKLANENGRRVDVSTAGEHASYRNAVYMSAHVDGPLKRQHKVVYQGHSFRADLHFRMADTPHASQDPRLAALASALAGHRITVEFHGPYHYGHDPHLRDKHDVFEVRLRDDMHTQAYLEDVGAAQGRGSLIIIDYTAYVAFTKDDALATVLCRILDDANGKMPGWIFIHLESSTNMPGTEYPGTGRYNVSHIPELKLAAKWISAGSLGDQLAA